MGGYLFLDGPPPNDTVIMHDRTTQGSYSAIRHEGKWGYEWWVLEAFDPSAPFEEDLHEFAPRAPAASRTRCPRWSSRRPASTCSAGRSAIASRSSSGPRAG